MKIKRLFGKSTIETTSISATNGKLYYRDNTGEWKLLPIREINEITN